MKIALLVLSFAIPSITWAMSPIPPDANDLYCEQVQPAGGGVPSFQLQVSDQYKDGGKEIFVAVKYDSIILPDHNFEGSQSFTAKYESKTYNSRLESKLESGESFSSIPILSQFNQELNGIRDYVVSNVSPSSKLTEIRVNTEGPAAKAVVLRFIQVGQSIDISVIGMASRELSLKEGLQKDEENASKGIYGNRQVRTDFNVYDYKVTCKVTSRYSHTEARPNLIK